MDQGKLVPDEITIEIIKDRLNEQDVENGVILDGFPRTVEQAKALDKMLAERGQKVDKVINLSTPEQEIIERIVNRRICSNQECRKIYNLVLNPPKVEGICDRCGSKLITRKDDTEETVKARIKDYNIETKPLIEFYQNKGILETHVVSVSINHLGQDVANEVVEEIKNNK